MIQRYWPCRWYLKSSSDHDLPSAGFKENQNCGVVTHRLKGKVFRSNCATYGVRKMMAMAVLIRPKCPCRYLARNHIDVAPLVVAAAAYQRASRVFRRLLIQGSASARTYPSSKNVLHRGLFNKALFIEKWNSKAPVDYFQRLVCSAVSIYCEHFSCAVFRAVIASMVSRVSAAANLTLAASS